MKICFLVDSTSWHVKKWLEYFITQGHEIHIISTKPFWDSRVKSHIVDTITLDANKNITKLYRSYRAFRKLIKEIKPDILHTISVRNGIFAAIINFQPFILTGLGWDILMRPKTSFLKRMETIYILSKVNLSTSDSYYTQKEMLKYQKNKNSELIVFGVDQKQFHEKVNVDNLKKELEITDQKVVLSPRSMLENSNISTIIMTIPLVLEKEPNTIFIFKYNYGNLKAKMEELAESLGVTKNVCFIGYIDDYKKMPSYYKISKVCISILSSDSTGRAWFESIACGTPLILSDIPNTHEWFNDRVDALIVPLQNIKATADAIIELLQNKELKEKLISNSKKIIETKADYTINMKKMETFYKSIILKDREKNEY